MPNPSPIAVPGPSIESLGGNCPVQAEGTFDGEPFYFRARGSSITCEVGEWCWDGPVYEWPDAGWISEEVARAYIATAYGAWRDRARKDAAFLRSYRDNNDHGREMMSAIRWAVFIEKQIGKERGAEAIACLMAEASRRNTLKSEIRP